MEVPPLKNGSHNPYITLARYLLAIYVLFFHLLPRAAYYGYDVQPFLHLQLILIQLFHNANETNPAVIAFLVLSGYCIHRNGLRINKIDLNQFFIRRIFRILPLFVLSSVLGAVIFLWLRDDPAIQTISNTASLSIAGILYKLSGLFAFIPSNIETTLQQGNGPLMTCAVEIWLYIFYPILMLLIYKFGSRFLWAMLASITLLGSVACTIYPELQAWWHNASFYGFLIYWWIGAYAVDRSNTLFKHWRPIVAAYLFLSAFLVLYPSAFAVVELRKILLALLVGCVLRLLEGFHTSKLFNSSFFASGFSLYALHMPLICLAMHYQLNFHVTWILILFVAYLSYLYIERPFVQLGQRIITQESIWPGQQLTSRA